MKPGSLVELDARVGRWSPAIPTAFVVGDGRDYVVVLNRRKETLELIPKTLLDSHWRPLFEIRRDPRDLLTKVGDDWYLPPYRVLVFESRLRWGSLFSRR